MFWSSCTKMDPCSKFPPVNPNPSGNPHAPDLPETCVLDRFSVHRILDLLCPPESIRTTRPGTGQLKSYSRSHCRRTCTDVPSRRTHNKNGSHLFRTDPVGGTRSGPSSPETRSGPKIEAREIPPSPSPEGYLFRLQLQPDLLCQQIRTQGLCETHEVETETARDPLWPYGSRGNGALQQEAGISESFGCTEDLADGRNCAQTYPGDFERKEAGGFPAHVPKATCPLLCKEPGGPDQDCRSGNPRRNRKNPYVEKKEMTKTPAEKITLPTKKGQRTSFTWARIAWYGMRERAPKAGK